MPKINRFVILLVFLFVLVPAFITLVDLGTEWLFFDEVGLIPVLVFHLLPCMGKADLDCATFSNLWQL